MFKKIACLVLSAITCITVLSGCGNNEYQMYNKIHGTLKNDQVSIKTTITADVSDSYMNKLSKKVDADYMVIVSELANKGINLDLTMDNYNGEYELIVSCGDNSNKITTIRSVKSGLYVNIKDLSNFLGKYGVTKEYSTELSEIMGDKEWIRYNYFTNLDKYKYGKLTSLMSDILSEINQNYSQICYVTKSKGKYTAKITSESEDLIIKNTKNALYKNNIISDIEERVVNYVKKMTTEDLKAITNDSLKTREEAVDDVERCMKSLDEKIKAQYETFIKDAFKANDYLEIIYTDPTYFDRYDYESSQTSEIGRLEIYNYNNGTSGNNSSAVYGNSDIKIDVVSIITLEGSTLDDYSDSYYGNSNKLGKLVVKPEGALSAETAADKIVGVIKSIDYKNKYDNIDISVDTNGYTPVASMDDNDTKVYKETKKIPLRKTAESLDIKVLWDSQQCKPGLEYKTKAGNYIRDFHIDHTIINGVTYVDKSLIEGILDCDLYVINNKVYKGKE